MYSELTRWLLVWPATKGVVIGVTVIGVINSGLSPFAQALIIALVSATIGALGIIVAALIASHEAQRQREHLQTIQQTSEDIKAAVGADRRRVDSDNGSS